MSNDVSIIVATYGNLPEWNELADRAVRSAEAQTVKSTEIIRGFGKTLSESRNGAATLATGEWLCFLDADDELDSRYCEAMELATGDIRRPATLGIVDGKEDDAPVMIPRRNLMVANYIVIGAWMRRSSFLAAGGFREFPVLEDWDLFLRLWLAGDQVVDVPDAIYRVHVQPNSRNQNQKLHGHVYNQIRRQYAGRSPLPLHGDAQ